jgi:biotin transport system substrate-specific component
MAKSALNSARRVSRLMPIRQQTRTLRREPTDPMTESMMAYATVADLARPARRDRAIAYDVAAVLGGSLLMTVCAKLSFHLPIAAGVPVTMQTFGVLVLAMLLGPARGTAAVLAYLAQGAAGLPVFANTGAGLAYMAGPTGGYLVGFVLAAALVGGLARAGWDRNYLRTLAAMSLGTALILACGWAWLAVLTGSSVAAWYGGVVPFLPGAAVKIALVVAVLPSGWKLLKRLA